MSKSDKSSEQKNLVTTVKMAVDPTEVELTQKIEVDYTQVVDASKKEVLLSEIRHEQDKTAESLVGKSIFNRKRITDDYVKSNTIISRINKVPPARK
jgi:hypothetical protein